MTPALVPSLRACLIVRRTASCRTRKSRLPGADNHLIRPGRGSGTWAICDRLGPSLTRTRMTVPPTLSRHDKLRWLRRSGSDLRAPRSALAAKAIDHPRIDRMSGTGKPSVIRELAALGYKAIDTDDGWCEHPPGGQQRWPCSGLASYTTERQIFCPSRWAASGVLGAQIVQFGMHAQPVRPQRVSRGACALRYGWPRIFQALGSDCPDGGGARREMVAAASSLLGTPSLRRMCQTWTLTVLTLMTSAAAISRLV